MFQVTTLLTGLDPAGAAAAAAEAGTLRQAVDAQGAAVKQVRLAGCMQLVFYSVVFVSTYECVHACPCARVSVITCFHNCQMCL